LLFATLAKFGLLDAGEPRGVMILNAVKFNRSSPKRVELRITPGALTVVA